MPRVTDGRGVEVSLERPPQRIVSLVPSTTETLFALGLGERVVGVTRFCVHPKSELAGLTRVGGTKDIELERVEALRPDLILGNAEENTREMFEALGARWPLYVAFPKDVDSALADLRAMGTLLGVAEESDALARRIDAARAGLRPRRFTFAYLIWRSPWMAVSGDTFISQLLGEFGGVNVLAGASERYPQVQVGDIAGAERVLLSSEPFPFKRKHIDELEAAGVPRARLRLVDGELASWHGARMLRAFQELGGALS